MLSLLWLVGAGLCALAANFIYTQKSLGAKGLPVERAVSFLVIGILLMAPGTFRFAKEKYLSSKFETQTKVITDIAAPVFPIASAPSRNASATNNTSSELDTAGAWGVCKEFVNDRLTAPSTAKFPWSYTDRVTDLGEGHYRVKSYVDAQNSFGATVRTNYICEVTKTGKEDWKLESLTTS